MLQDHEDAVVVVGAAAGKLLDFIEDAFDDLRRRGVLPAADGGLEAPAAVLVVMSVHGLGDAVNADTESVPIRRLCFSRDAAIASLKFDLLELGLGLWLK